MQGSLPPATGRELHHGQRILGDKVPPVKIQPRLVTDVSSVVLVAVKVLENRGTAFSVMTFHHERDFTLFFTE